MREKSIKIISVVLCAVVILGVVLATRTVLHGASSTQLLYYNDRAWAKENRLPAEKVYTVYYIPVSLLAQLDGVEVYNNEKLRNFWISNGDKFISFDLESNFASFEDKTRIFIMTYEFHGEYYVPAKEVCKHLGLGYEELVSTVTGGTAIRITDGTEALAFEQLIRDKYPDFFETSAPTTDQTTPAETTSPVTTAPVTGETSEPVDVLGDRTIYLTIEDSPGIYTEDILAVLADYGYRATFFIVGEQAADNPVLLSAIVAGGNAVALHTMDHGKTALTSVEELLTDMDAENALLYSLIKQKSRIWRAPEGSDALSVLTRAAEIEFNHRGYLVWDYNIDATGFSSIEKAAEAVIEGIWDNETAVIRLADTADTPLILRRVLSFIASNAAVCDVRTISPAYYEYNHIG